MPQRKSRSLRRGTQSREVREAVYGLRGRKVDEEIVGGNYGFVYHNLWMCVIMDRKFDDVRG